MRHLGDHLLKGPHYQQPEERLHQSLSGFVLCRVCEVVLRSASIIPRVVFDVGAEEEAIPQPSIPLTGLLLRLFPGEEEGAHYRRHVHQCLQIGGNVTANGGQGHP